MSTVLAEPATLGDLLRSVRSATPGVQARLLNELVRLLRERHDNTEAPLFVRNEDDLVTAILIPCAIPFDPSAHTKEPGYEEQIRREMEEAIRRDGPPIKLH